MHTFSLWNILLLVVTLVPVALFALVARKAGYSPWWALLGLVPLVNIIALYVFAYREWPGLARTPAEAATLKAG